MTRDPNNLPDLGQRVGFEVTFVSVAHVLQTRVEWGIVQDMFYHSGDTEGFSLAGYYVEVELFDGNILNVNVNDIISVNR